MDFNIGKVKFSSKKTVIIAEAGVNHLGRMDYAEELIKTAKRAGADIIKFQTYKAKNLTIRDAPRFWNWEGERDDKGSQYDSYSILDSFGRKEYEKLFSLCEQYGIEFLSTPFDNESAKMLVDIGMKGFKIASGDITNIPFIRYIGSLKLPVLLSTGASTIDEIRNAVEVIEENGCTNIGIMQCTLCYPTEPENANLNAIKHIASEFKKHLIGLSDHTLGTIIPAASILYGVSFIEKHYTFDKTLPDSADHWLSLDEKKLSQLVEYVRILEKSLGESHKQKMPCETDTHKFARRSLVSQKNLRKGHILTQNDLTCKRPGTGLPPAYYDRFIGRKTKRDIPEDTLLKISDIE